MKIARFFSYIFACIGTLLLVGSMGFFLWNRNAQVRIQQLPREAVAVSEAFAQALNDGDLEAAAQLMYGQPDLGVGTVPENPETALLWEAFRDSIAVELKEEWTVEQGNLVRTCSITTMDVSVVVGNLQERVQSALDQRIASAQNLAEIYDEQNNYREELTEQVIQEALQQVMTQDAESMIRDVTIKLVNRDGRWWVVPHQNLLQILTGLA